MVSILALELLDALLQCFDLSMVVLNFFLHAAVFLNHPHSLVESEWKIAMHHGFNDVRSELYAMLVGIPLVVFFFNCVTHKVKVE